VWKNPQNDRPRKSRFHAPNFIRADNRHDKAHWRATRGKIARAAEPLPNFPSRTSIAVQIVIDAKNRVFPHNPSTPAVRGANNWGVIQFDEEGRVIPTWEDDDDGDAA
jgi:hypothetical protein